MEVRFTHDGIDEFISKLDKPTQAKIRKTIERLIYYGHDIQMPYSKNIGNGLFELRILGKINVRILYIFRYNEAYLLHIFNKKRWSIPKKEIEHAHKIMNLLID